MSFVAISISEDEPIKATLSFYRISQNGMRNKEDVSEKKFMEVLATSKNEEIVKSFLEDITTNGVCEIKEDFNIFNGTKSIYKNFIATQSAIWAYTNILAGMPYDSYTYHIVAKFTDRWETVYEYEIDVLSITKL